MKKIILIAFAFASLMLQSCVENYSNGERIGVITRFSQKGLVFKSWEGNLNVTQTGMNTSGEPFMFSVDNEKDNNILVAIIDSAADKGWKVKVVYHESYNTNIWGLRGETSFFIDDLEVLDKKFTEKLQFNNNDLPKPAVTGKIIDTIYVVIDNRK